MTRQAIRRMHGRPRSPIGVIVAVAVSLLLATSLPVVAATRNEALRDAIRVQVAQLDAQGGLYIQGLPIASGRLLPDFYVSRDYAPVWTSSTRIAELFALLATAETHGLDSRDYYLPELRQLREHYRASKSSVQGRDSSARLGAALDMLLTESLIRFGYHQRFGKVNPQAMEPTWNFTRRIRVDHEPLTILREAVAAPSLSGFLLEWLARAPFYRSLQEKLREFRAIAADGGWPVIAAGVTLREGERDSRLAVIRRRLLITGQLPKLAAADPDLFDADLVAGVLAFQAAYGLKADGIIGARTIDAMNVPVATRIDQLRLSLERARWVADDTTGDVIVVNVAGFEVIAARDGKPYWRRRAVVGQLARQTPIFKGSMTYIDLNPTWTVPRSILREDILPKVWINPGYLRANNISVLDRRGRIVDPGAIDWAAVGDRPPYTFRQEPGPNNALGRMKFMFPNPHAIYLHDTPSRNLFDKSERLFSSGCIRVEDPMSLAELLLADSGRWNRASLEAALATGQTQTVRLPHPWPVLILYWTAEIDGQGQLRFHRDVYDRDPALLDALNGEVRIEFPAIASIEIPAALLRR